MKKQIVAIGMGILSFFGMYQDAEANPHRTSYYSEAPRYHAQSHASQSYTERVLVGYDHCGNPIYTYRRICAPQRVYVAPCQTRRVYVNPQARYIQRNPRSVVSFSYRF